jgi:hypothetical protein
MREAVCEDGVVRVGEIEVPDMPILSEGVAESEGFAFFQAGNKVYITSSASDLKESLTQLGSILQSVITILTGLDAVTVSPGGQAANIASLTSLKTTFDLIKDNLK